MIGFAIIGNKQVTAIHFICMLSQMFFKYVQRYNKRLYFHAARRKNRKALRIFLWLEGVSLLRFLL